MDSGSTVRIIGHRGMGRAVRGAQEPENSIPSFLAALRTGADGIEFDVQLTADDEVVVHHDNRVGRTTRGRHQHGHGIGHHEVAELTAERLTAMQLRGTPEATIPLLAEVVDAIRPALIAHQEVWVELKRQRSPERAARLVERTLELLADDPIWPRVVLRSFDISLLAASRRRRPDARAHALSIVRIEQAVTMARRHGLEGVAIFHPLAHDKTMRLVAGAGLVVCSGGLPTEAQLDNLLRLSATYGHPDVICTDRPDLAVARRAELVGR